MKIKSYRDLEVWQKAMDMVDMVYKVTETFPKSEMFGLTSQMRRSAVSVASNIAEGSARDGTRELLRFLYIVRGSLAELQTQTEIAVRRNYSSQEELAKTLELSERIGQMSARLIQSLQKKT